MAPGSVNIVMLYGGAFSKEGVGFKDGDTLFYVIPGRSLDDGIDHLKDDTSALEMMKYANQTNCFEVWIQQKEHNIGAHPTVGDTVQEAITTQNMARLPSKSDMLVLCQQMTCDRMTLFMALHIAFLYWFFVVRTKRPQLIREPCRFDPASRMKNLNDKPRPRSRKNDIATNVLAACTPDMQFSYVLAGWEGSAADARVLRDALTRPNGLRVPRGCYYLVDAGYRNCEGFLAPYRGQRYHLKEWGNPPTRKEELFNMKHSSARNVIERTFSLLKNRWGIIRNGSYYPIDTQIAIILACC